MSTVSIARVRWEGFLSRFEATPFTIGGKGGSRHDIYHIGQARNCPGLLWVHGAGMAAGAYFPLLSRLADHYEVYALDLRGHGRSALRPEGDSECWNLDTYATDLDAAALWVEKRLGGRSLSLVTHSFGGTVALRLAGTRQRELAWKRLIAFDPPVFPPKGSGLQEEIRALVDARLDGIAKKRRCWQDPDALRDKLATVASFERWDSKLRAAYAEATLLPTRQGDYRLACLPPIESRLFRLLLDTSTWDRLARVSVPVSLFASDPQVEIQSWAVRVQAALAAALPSGKLEVIPGADHMLPFEQPETCARLIGEEIDRR